MKIEKRFLTQMNRCYAANQIVVDGKSRILLATEGEGPCMAWEGPDYHQSHHVWQAPGGTMSIVPISGTNGEFLAVQKFFRMFDWEEAKIVHVRPQENKAYEVSDLLNLPYIHRFDLLTVGEKHYFIGCTLATKKATKDDWSNPGKIWVGEFDGKALVNVRVLKEGLTKNHGYSRLKANGKNIALVTAHEGAFMVTPPQTPGAEWSIEQIMDWPISDIAAIDIDNDGELEFATIEPFHGEYFRVYKKIDGAFKKVFEHPEVTEFYHVVVAAKLVGTPVFIGGCRRGRQQLFYLYASSQSPLQFALELIEEGVGPSNVHVINEDKRDIIVAANREKAEAALYFVSP